jgi:hypothetical protein
VRIVGQRIEIQISERQPCEMRRVVRHPRRVAQIGIRQRLLRVDRERARQVADALLGVASINGDQAAQMLRIEGLRIAAQDLNAQHVGLEGVALAPQFDSLLECRVRRRRGRAMVAVLAV